MTREEVIKKMQAVKAYMTSGNPIWGVTEMGEAFDMAINALEQTAWIPCSERLPEKAVLCCDDRGDMIIGYPYSDKDSDTGFSAESDDIFLLNCIAWMPLPEPWEG